MSGRAERRAPGCAGIVLAGGRSSRMGRPKAWLELGGQTLLQRAVATVGSVCDRVVVVGAPGQELPVLAEDVLRATDPVEGRGPLQGLVAGLEALAVAGSSVAYLSSCDVPLLRPAFIEAVLDRLGDADIAVPRDGKFHHPLAAAYRLATVLPAAQELLAQDRLRPFFLFELLRTVEIPVDELRTVDPDLESLQNCNTPEDLDALTRKFGE